MAIAFLFGGMVSAETGPVAKFSTPEEKETVNDQGVVTLAWKADDAEDGTLFELQQGADTEFGGALTRYRGVDRGSVLTGFAAGDYYFRVRAVEPDGDWSEPVKVTIEYMERSKVIFLLGVGIVVFFGTTGTLLVCHFRKPVS